MKKPILNFVLAFHITLLIIAFFSYQPLFPKSKKKLLVRTHVETAPKLAVNQTKPQPTKAAPKPAPAKKPTPRKEPEKRAKPAPAKKPPPPPKPAVDQKKQHEAQKILSEIEESLKKIDAPIEIKKSSALSTPKTIETLSVNAQPEEESAGPSYSERITAHLQRALLLPEIGEVKIKLTLSPEGKVSDLEVLACASDKNRTYLEKELPRQIFPPLEKKKSESFILTFCNNHL